MPKTARGLNYVVTDLRPAWRRGKDSGRPVVFHHGVGASLEIFDDWVPIIAAHHPIVRFDMRGFGQSTVPPKTHDWAMRELVEDMLEIAQAAFGGEPVHAMGESIGGTIALAATMRNPGGSFPSP
jgi:pimeloyl-ACP methyl ester carboxylesterase